MEGDRIDVRRQPLVVRDGCAPDRIPAGRWPSDTPLVRSEQFAVNEALACLCPADERPAGKRPADEGPAGKGPAGKRPADEGPAGKGASQGTAGRDSQGGADGPGDRVFAVHAPPGTGVAEVFGDLVAAVVTERARRLADLPDPSAAFGEVLTWGPHAIVRPAAELAGFEVVQSAPAPKPVDLGWAVPAARPGTRVMRAAAASGAATAGRTGTARPAAALPPVGAQWRRRAATADYFASTARLSDGVGAWAMLVARLGDGAANRAFAERWWRGTVRGTDVLFPAGESMTTALQDLAGRAVDWSAAVSWFRSTLARAEDLAAERSAAAAALTRLSRLEQACEEAYSAADAAEARLAELTAREPAARDAVAAAEDGYRAALAALGAHDLSRPELNKVTRQGVAALQSRGALSVAWAGAGRRARNYREWLTSRRRQRDAAAAAEEQLETALRAAEALHVRVTQARTAVAAQTAEVSRLTAAMEPVAETVAAARRRWGDHVPAGPSQAETEDPLLIEWRETTAPWADEEYASARAQVFIAALELHKALIAAQAGIFEANLAALMDIIADGPPAGDGSSALEHSAARKDEAAGAALAATTVPADVLLAVWQSFFLVVPVVQVPFEAAATLFGPLGAGSLGWLLAAGAEQLAADAVPGLLHWFRRAVCAGDALLASESGRGLANRARYGTWLPSAVPTDEGEPRWVGMPLRVVRGQDRETVDQRNDVAYDGLLISDRE